MAAVCLYKQRCTINMYKYLVVCYFILIFVTNAVADISLDYYFGNDESLRSASNFGTCLSEKIINSCNEKCGPRHACLLGQCFCVTSIFTSQPKAKYGASGLLEESDEDTSESYEDYDDTPTTLTAKKYFSDEIEQRPALRHHIAHFCPNLAIARVCIRKCMKVAKPAFCGKDHVCYCGHKYGFPGVDPKLNAADVHGQFRDLYEKYFGPKKGGSVAKLRDRLDGINIF